MKAWKKPFAVSVGEMMGRFSGTGTAYPSTRSVTAAAMSRASVTMTCSRSGNFAVYGWPTVPAGTNQVTVRKTGTCWNR